MQDFTINILPSKFLLQNSKNYYHFIFDIFFSLFVFLKNNNLLDEEPTLILRSKTPFDGIFNLLTNKKIKYSSRPSKIDNNVSFDSSKMYLGSDLLVNSNTNQNKYSKEDLNQLLLEFREYITNKLSLNQEENSAQNLTIIKRKNSRVILNHKELLKKLAEKEISVKEVCLEELSFKEQVQIMQNTKILIGAHGSGLSNILFLPKKAKAIEINPFGWGINMYKELSQYVGCSYYDVMGEHDDLFYLTKETKKIRKRKEEVEKITKDNSPIFSDYELRYYVREQNIKVDINKLIKLI